MTKLVLTEAQHTALKSVRILHSEKNVMANHLTNPDWAGATKEWQPLSELSIEQMAIALFDPQGYEVLLPDQELIVDKELRDHLKAARSEPYNTYPDDPEDEFSQWRQGFDVAMEILSVKLYTGGGH